MYMRGRDLNIYTDLKWTIKPVLTNNIYYLQVLVQLQEVCGLIFVKMILLKGFGCPVNV